MARLPQPGSDDGTWGNILNTFLDVAHNSDGSLQTSAIAQAGGITSINGKSPSNGVLTLAASNIANAVQLGGDIGGTTSSPTVSKINGITVSGTPSNGQALVAQGTTNASWSSALTANKLYVDSFGADPTGATDSTAAFVAAQTAGGSGAYQLVLGVGTYTIGKSGDIKPFGRHQGMEGQGQSLTTLTYYGSATAIAAFDSSFDSTNSIGGSFSGFSIDGTNAGTNAIGMSWGNLLCARCHDISIYSFSGVGLQMKNSGSTAWSEEAEWTAIRLDSNAINVLWDTGSFDYSTYDFVIIALAGQDGLRLQNDAALEGVKLSIQGNFITGAGNTAAVIAIDRGNSSGTSRIDGAQIYINVESDGSTGLGHTTILMNGSSSSQFTGTGVLFFRNDATPFQGYTNTNGAQFGIAGVVNDPTLGEMSTSDALAVAGGSTWRTSGTLTSVNDAQIYLQFADVQAFQLASGSTALAFYGQPDKRARRIELFIAQPSSGAAGTITWPPNVLFPGGIPSLSSTNGAVDRVRLTYIASSGNWYGELTANYKNSGTVSVPAVIDTTAGDISADGLQAAGTTGLAADAGHTHPSLTPWSASDQGYITWNADPALLSGTFTPTSGTIYVSGLFIRKPSIIAHVTTGVTGTVPAGVTSGQNFIGLYNAAGTRLAQTATDTSYNSAGTYSVVSTSLSGGMLSPGFYWIAWLMNATTMPSIIRIGGIMGSLTNAGLYSTTARGATAGTAQTALPPTFSPSSLSLTSDIPWVALS
ncbi:MAG TPA: hypothetical protein VFQ70_03730 [Candidatus Saccharimonadaceae bacterium]|nr:hypothetical protein [Candidatus Saccharimonadaceae bacterium]